MALGFRGLQGLILRVAIKVHWVLRILRGVGGKGVGDFFPLIGLIMGIQAPYPPP